MNLANRLFKLEALEKQLLVERGLIGMVSPDLPNVIAILDNRTWTVSIKPRSEVKTQSLSALVEVSFSKLDDGFKTIFEHKRVCATELAPLFAGLYEELERVITL